MGRTEPEPPTRPEPASQVMRPVSRRQRRPEGTVPKIADHEILRIIGTGAYGEVWLARTVTGAYRAVKVVWREDFEDERSFIREFEGILQYEPIARHNPGLVHILHVGRQEGEYPYYYYVMELADDAYTGIHMDAANYRPRTLRSDMQLYGLHAMPLDYVLEVGSQLAHALAGLHAEELIHRDVKPANVVFVNSRAKLADAGLVTHNSRRTFVGTEGYIPPDGPGTPRADVYALAKVLYEMSTGKDRLDFPALPSELPEGTSQRRWLEFNSIICAAAHPIVSRKSIITAQALAEQLDALRHYTPLRKKKTATAKTGKPTKHPRYKLAIALLVVALTLALGLHFLPGGFIARLQEAAAVLAHQAPPAPQAPQVPTTPPQSTTQAAKESRLLISTVPSGASVYTDSLEYLGDTPYGPVPTVPGQKESYLVRMAGYADMRIEGTAPTNGLLKLGGTLTPYRPPRSGQAWRDAQGTTYTPEGNTHKADTAVTRVLLEEFIRNSEEGKDVSYEQIPGTELVRVAQADIGAYTLWLTRQCTENGTIGRDHSLVAEPEPGTAERGLCGYRLRTQLVMKTPITIYTNPAGATVMFNGQVLGVTPMQEFRVPIAPYLLEIRLPGHSTIRRSGLSPKGLNLNLHLAANNSVVFGAEWINSLGQKYIPLRPGLLAAATEVRVADFSAYCQATNTPLPPEPLFEHNEHHPVVNVSRHEAEAFAAWLTQTEQDKGLIEDTDFYRLPTDTEWSTMAELPAEQGESPYEREQHYTAFAELKFAWGNRWPPTRDSGNFADTSAQIHVPQDQYIELYRDGFPYTAPVGSFPANAPGLHDLCGNVQEWVSDPYGGPAEFGLSAHGVTRGGAFTSFSPKQLHLGHRVPLPPEERVPTVGFRLILERKPH